MSALSALASYDISDEEDVKDAETGENTEKAGEPDEVTSPVKAEEHQEPKQEKVEKKATVVDVDEEDIWRDPEEEKNDEEDENEDGEEENAEEESKPEDDSIKDVEDLSVIHDGDEDDAEEESSGSDKEEAEGDLGEAMMMKSKKRNKRKSSENATNLAKKLRTSSVDEITIPPEPEGRCSSSLQDKITRFMERKVKDGEDLNRVIQARKDFRNPSIYEKLIVYLNIEELGTNFPQEDYNPKTWRKVPAYDELARAQREDMAKREKERKTKVEFVTGTVKKPSGTSTTQSSSAATDGVKKSKWDQQSSAKSSSDKSSGHKSTVISAVGSIKKTKV